MSHIVNRQRDTYTVAQATPLDPQSQSSSAETQSGRASRPYLRLVLMGRTTAAGNLNRPRTGHHSML
jgi:hypothetical protein